MRPRRGDFEDWFRAGFGLDAAEAPCVRPHRDEVLPEPGEVDGLASYTLENTDEVEIVDIPIATITDQYLEYLAVIEQLDVNAVGDFLALASCLIEIKSQQVLPRADEVEDEQAAAILKDLYRPLYLIETPFVITDVTTAELIKHASNA